MPHYAQRDVDLRELGHDAARRSAHERRNVYITEADDGALGQAVGEGRHRAFVIGYYRPDGSWYSWLRRRDLRDTAILRPAPGEV